MGDAEALEVNPDVTTISAALDGEKWRKYIEENIKKTNANGDVCPSNAAKIAKFSILPYDVSVSAGYLTPTLKLKRGVVEKNFCYLIDSMYEEKNKKNAYIRFFEEGDVEI